MPHRQTLLCLQVMSRIDKDKSGTLSRAELSEGLREVRPHSTSSLCTCYMAGVCYMAGAWLRHAWQQMGLELHKSEVRALMLTFDKVCVHIDVVFVRVCGVCACV